MTDVPKGEMDLAIVYIINRALYSGRSCNLSISNGNCATRRKDKGDDKDSDNKDEQNIFHNCCDGGDNDENVFLIISVMII